MGIERRLDNVKRVKITECSNNGAHLAKKTDEGYLCGIQGCIGCKYLGTMSQAYTLYFKCKKAEELNKIKPYN